MLIPSYVNSKIVDDNGVLLPEWQQLITQLLTELQNNLSNEGYVLPRLPTNDINYLGSTPETLEKSIGAMIYDSITNEFKVNLNGTWHVVQVI